MNNNDTYTFNQTVCIRSQTDTLPVSTLLSDSDYNALFPRTYKLWVKSDL